MQVNLPVSVRAARRLVTHSNAGLTLVRDAGPGAGKRADARAVSLGQSLVFLAGDRFNLMIEGVWSSYDVVTPGGATERERSAFVSPGARVAFDLASGLQIVPGVAFPIGVGPSDGERAVLLYLSFEHAFAPLSP